MRRKPALCEYPYLGLSVAHKAAWPPFLPQFQESPSEWAPWGHTSAVIAPLRPC